MNGCIFVLYNLALIIACDIKKENMDWLFDALIKITEATVLAIVVHLLTKFIPAKSRPKEIDFEEFIDNPKKASKWDFLFLLYMLIILPAIAYPFAILFEKLVLFTENYFSDAQIVLFPPFITFYSSTLLIVYTLACKPSDSFLKTILKNRYNEYQKLIAYKEYESGINYKKFNNGLFVFLSIITVGILFLQIKSQAYFYPDRVEFFDFPTWKNVSYNYNDISRIIHTQGFVREAGGVDDHEHYRIYFKDNNHWSSLTWNDLNADTINAVKIVSEKTKKIIEEIPGITK